MFVLLDPTKRLVIAHRGNSMHAPEDTLESLRQGMALGADGLEFDVRLSADGVPMVIHDPTLDRTTDGTGPVAARTRAELLTLDAGYRFTRDGGRTYPYRGRGIQIPTLDEALATFPAAPCIIELKAPEVTEPFIRAVEKHDAKDRVLVGSFSDEAHAQLEGRGFHITASKRAITQLFLRAFTPFGAGTVTHPAYSVPNVWKHLPIPVRRFSRMLRKRGIPTHCWTINDPRVAQRLWDGGVNAILSDDPGTMLALLGRAPGASPPAESR
ncbi:MAG: glycerophosphodiester phosphodiesterase family protein [Gemmatimonadaceae bacterium]|nr:glycerophosphodiester phosphodiesterase family protein [Gemmatimonadaceae bacterium]